MELYQIADKWVRALAVPEHPATDGREGRFVGTALVLRLDGQIVGRGTSCGDDGQTMARAARAAITEATSRLPDTNDALAAGQHLSLAPRLRISLEFSGTLVPITPATFTELDVEIPCGLVGLAARIGSTTAAVFPASMLTTGTLPSDALAAAISSATGDPTAAIKLNAKAQPPQIAADRNATFYRFSTTHLAQLAPDAQPIFLFRGGKLISTREITTARLRAFADHLADYLMRWSESRRVDSGWPQSTYHPTRGIHDPTVASLAEYAVAAYAMHRYLAIKARFQTGGDSDWKWTREVTPDIARPRFGPERLSQQPLGNATPGPVFGSLRALVAMSPMESRPANSAQTLAALAPLESDLAAAFSAETGGEWSKDIPENGRAFVAFVLTRRATLFPDASDAITRRGTAEAAVRSVYRDAKPTNLVMHMPYLGWAELLLAGDTAAQIPAGAALRDMREIVWQHQLTAADAGADGPDLVGGIVFTGSSNRFPTAQSLRPLAFLATMVGDARLTDPPEVMREISHQLEALRFIRQLSLDEFAARDAVDPPTALWGIRAGLWDNRQAPEATALALLTVCETLRSLDEIAKRK